MNHKKCLGPFHPPGGEMVPLENFTVNKSGPRKGKPLSRCRTCRNLSNSSTIPKSVFTPLLTTLMESKDIKSVSEMTNLSVQALRELQSGKTKRIYKKTFLKLNRAVASLPKVKTSIGPQNKKTKREINKLTYEERLELKKRISVAQKQRYIKDKQLLKY